MCIVNGVSSRSQAQIIETFHLLFLRVLAAGARADWFTLKGGANIRYFFASPRYSNDIELDFAGRKSWNVADTVASVLSGTAMKQLGRASRIELVDISLAKQTETTLRWKIGLGAPDHQDLIRTRIEFSGRGDAGDDAEFAVVPNEIVQPYGVAAPTVCHYLETAAIDQKIAALALRTETKARDVFDLELLLRRRRALRSDLKGLDPAHAGTAAEKALTIPFASFTTEVAPFLEPDMAALYGESDWDGLCVIVAGGLEEVAASEPPVGGEAP